MGVNLPGSVGADPRIDAERLEPFYDRVEELGLPLFLHPTDAVFADMLSDGYGGALHLSLGRVVEVSVAAMRLVFSGVMERHPNLKLVMSHTGGALPYQAGRMDKNGKKANLPHQPSEYIKRFYTDTVTPHSLGMRYAVEFFGVDHVMYGTDYPCWSPADALRFFAECGFSEEVQAKIFAGNAERILGDPGPYAGTRSVLTPRYAASAARILDTASKAGAQYADVQFWTIRQEDVAVRNGDVRDCLRRLVGRLRRPGADRRELGILRQRSFRRRCL